MFSSNPSYQSSCNPPTVQATLVSPSAPVGYEVGREKPGRADGVIPLPAPKPINYSLAASLGFGKAAIDAVSTMRKAFSHEVCIIDNSSSTSNNNDSSHGVVIKGNGKNAFLGTDSIWAQIGQTVARRANVIKAMGVGSDVKFKLLNPVDDFTRRTLINRGMMDANDPQGRISADHIADALKMIRPHGTTPLIPRIQEVTQELRVAQQQGQNVNAHISFYTDGMPTDERGIPTPLQHVAFSLKELFADIRATVVIHITTSDQSVVDFYNDLDACTDESLSIDVMVDLKSEQAEIDAAGNGWFKQTEAGEVARVYFAEDDNFDNLDEEALNVNTASHIMRQLYFGNEDHDLPDPELNFSGFVKACKAKIAEAPQSFGVVNGRLQMTHILNPDAFPKPKGVDAGCMCTIM